MMDDRPARQRGADLHPPSPRPARPQKPQTRFEVGRAWETEYSENYDVMGRLGKPQEVVMMKRALATPKGHAFGGE